MSVWSNYSFPCIFVWGLESASVFVDAYKVHTTENTAAVLPLSSHSEGIRNQNREQIVQESPLRFCLCDGDCRKHAVAAFVLCEAAEI